MELIGAERDWEPPAGGTWNPKRKVWPLRYDRVVALGLNSRIATTSHPMMDARGRTERISMQMPERAVE
jgi:hypothetical protein